MGKKSRLSIGTAINPYVSERLRLLNMDIRFVVADGLKLVDDRGCTYRDFTSQYGCLPFGHNNKRIIAALERHLNNATPVFIQPSSNSEADRLSKRLLDHAGFRGGYCTFANSGAEAVEAAIKIARCSTKRKIIVSIVGSFHGKTTGALTLTSSAQYKAPYFLDQENVIFVDRNNEADLRAALSKHNVAALIIEPVQGESGVHTYSKGFINIANRICKERNILLIADEVQTGLGRIGETFGSRAVGLIPDIVCLSKALSGGIIPIGATLMRNIDNIEQFHETHSSTFAGNTLAASCGNSVLDLLEDDGALENVRLNGNYLFKRLVGIKAKFGSLISDVRGAGLLYAIEFSESPVLGASPVFSEFVKEGIISQLFCSYLLNVCKVRILPSLISNRSIRIQPPLNVSRREIDYLIEKLGEALSHFESGDFGSIYTSCFEGKRSPYLPRKPKKDNESKDYDFIFLGHPFSYKDFSTIEPNLKQTGQMRMCLSSLHGVFRTPIHCDDIICEVNGTLVKGAFYIIPMTPDEMIRHPEKCRELIGKIIPLAKKNNIGHVGLGAYTSIVSAGGSALPKDKGVTITNGNTLTAIASVKQAIAIATSSGSTPVDYEVIILGGLGSVGRRLILCAARYFSSITIIPSQPFDNKRSGLALRSIINKIYRNRNSAAEGSKPGSILSDNKDKVTLEHLQKTIVISDQLPKKTRKRIIFSCISGIYEYTPDARSLCDDVEIIIDVSRPLSIKITGDNENCLYFESGNVVFPQSPCSESFDFKTKGVFGCLSETILLSCARHVNVKASSVDFDVAYINEVCKLYDAAELKPYIEGTI